MLTKSFQQIRGCDEKNSYTRIQIRGYDEKNSMQFFLLTTSKLHKLLLLASLTSDGRDEPPQNLSISALFTQPPMGILTYGSKFFFALLYTYLAVLRQTKPRQGLFSVNHTSLPLYVVVSIDGYIRN